MVSSNLFQVYANKVDFPNENQMESKNDVKHPHLYDIPARFDLQAAYRTAAGTRALATKDIFDTADTG